MLKLTRQRHKPQNNTAQRIKDESVERSFTNNHMSLVSDDTSHAHIQSNCNK